MGALEAAVWGTITVVASGALALVGFGKARRARRVLATPTTPASRPEAGDAIEVKGRVAVAGRVLKTPLGGRDAVFYCLSIKEDQGSSNRTIVDEVVVVPFLVDDGSGRTARVEPAYAEKAVDFPDQDTDLDAPRAEVLALLAARKLTDFNPDKLLWSQRALLVGAPVYVLGPATVVVGPPVAEGYRSVTTTQLLLRPTSERPLIVAAMTEEAYVAQLTRGAGTYYGIAAFVALAGLVASLIAFATECKANSDF